MSSSVVQDYDATVAPVIPLRRSSSPDPTPTPEPAEPARRTEQDQVYFVRVTDQRGGDVMASVYRTRHCAWQAASEAVLELFRDSAGADFYSRIPDPVQRVFTFLATDRCGSEDIEVTAFDVL